MTDNGQKGTCCPTSPEGFKNEGGKCVRRTESSSSSSWQTTTSFWQQRSGSWFEWRGQRIEITDHSGRGGFLVSGYFYEYKPGGITVGGSTIVVGQSGTITVDGQQVDIVDGVGGQGGTGRPNNNNGQQVLDGHGAGGGGHRPTNNGGSGDQSTTPPNNSNTGGNSGGNIGTNLGDQGHPAFRPKDV